MAKRDRLGKGLGALLAEYAGEEEAQSGGEGSIRRLAVGSIEPNPFQPRREFDEAELNDLGDSIRENGLLQPIVVRPVPGAARSGAEWQLVAGERRWRAVTRLGWSDVPAVVRDVDDRTLLVLALVENLQRSQLTALDEAEAYAQLQREFGLSQQDVADAVGKDRSTVANTVRLLQLPASVRTLLGEGHLTAGHARALLGLDDERAMADVARRAVAEKWSVREVEENVGSRRGATRTGKRAAAAKDTMPGSARARRDAAERKLEEELQRIFGTAVRIKRTRKAQGRIEIPFYSAEDFERIFEELSGVPASDLVS